MSAGFVLAAVIGAVIAIAGSSGDRIVGLAIVLMFGGGGLAWWMVNRRRARAMQGFQVGQVATAGGSEAAFVARSDRTVLISGVAGSAAFGVGMLLVALAPGDAADLDGLEFVLMVVGGLFLIGVALFGLMRLANNSQFALTRRGLHAVGPGGWFVPWDAIAGIAEVAVHGNPFLGVRVSDPEAVRMHRLLGIGRWLQRSAMGVDLSIPIRTLMVDPGEFAGAIARYRQHPEYRGRIGRADELELLRSLATPEARVAPRRKPRPRRSLRRVLAIGSLFLIGGLFVLVVAAVASEEVRPGRELSRLIGLIVLGGLALGQLAAAVLLVRNVSVGRTIAIVSIIGLIGLILYGLAQGDPDGRPVGLGLLAIVGAQLLLVLVGARVARVADSPAGDPRP